MGVPTRHILSQGPVLSSLGRTALLAARQALQSRRNGGSAAHAPLPSLPGPEVAMTRSRLPRALVDDYVRHLGADPRAYRGWLPPHLFPQWCMPALARTLEGVPYPLLRAINGGCRVQVHAELPDHEPLRVRARLLEVDDDGKRAVLHQHAWTGTSSVPDALEIDFYVIVPLANGKGTHPSRKARSARSSSAATGNGGGHGKSSKQRAHVPDGARELERIRLGKDAGLQFAL